jgi:two-component system LytT family response regulator
MKLKVAIVDDEEHCIETLKYDLEESYSEKVEVLFECSNSVECVENLRSIKPDVLFIDIEMPGLNGFELIKVIQPKETKVVFTTAHARHAVEAINFKPEAYLLKPIELEELGKVVECLYQAKKPAVDIGISDKLAISTTEDIELVKHSTIVYAKASNNYTELILEDGSSKLISKTLKFVSAQLPESSFFRVHKSYLINLNHINKYRKADGGMLIMSNDAEIPVSGDKKEDLLILIQR